MVPHLVTEWWWSPAPAAPCPGDRRWFSQGSVRTGRFLVPWPHTWVTPLLRHYTLRWLLLPNITAMVCASHEAAAGRRRGDRNAPRAALLGAVFSLLPSLCVEELRAGTHSAQGTAACRFPHSTCTSCSRPRASKTSFQRWAETKHTPGASTC